MVTFEELQKLWEPYRGLTKPPAQTVTLWSAGGCGIFISNDWGPAVPYGPVDHGDGTKNHGYLKLKDDLSRIGQIPEVENWPELQRFMEALNAPSSPIESAGCEKGYFPNDEQGGPPVLLGSYIDVIFTNAALNDRPENPLLLASRLAQAVDSCEKWWAENFFCPGAESSAHGSNDALGPDAPHKKLRADRSRSPEILGPVP